MAGLQDFLRERTGGRVFHAVIVAGGDADTRREAVEYLARAAVCSGGEPPCGQCRDCLKALKGVHPDITAVRRGPEEKELRVDAMRAVRAAASVLPNEAARSVYAIYEAETMNTEAQNAMLKVFEEPPAHVVFLLETGSPERLLDTVRSRCEVLTLPPSGVTGPEPESAAAIWDACLRGDRLGLLTAVSALEKLEREELAAAVAALRRRAVAEYTRGRADRARFDAVTAAADRAEAFMAVNVSAGHIAGLFMSAFL